MTPRNLLPNLEVLNEYFDYDRENGLLFWKKVTTNRVKVGWPVGSPIGSMNHLATSLFGKTYLVHRIIWKMHTCQEPPDEIDHKDTISDNNKFDNLRPANRHTNLANSKQSFANTSGYKGVSLHPKTGLWRARIMVNYKDICIGYFKTKEEAAEVRKSYAIKLHGEYAREG